MRLTSSGGGAAKTTKSGITGFTQDYYNSIKDNIKTGTSVGGSNGSMSITNNGPVSGGYAAGGSGGGGGYQAGGIDYNAYLEAAKAARAQAIANANAALDRQGEVMKGKYDAQLKQVEKDYQDLKNQSEVNRYKALRNLRETQANRGLLESGAGRMENLRVSNNYNNALNEIGLQEENERNEIQLALESVLAEIAMKKAQNEIAGLDDYNTILQSMLSGGAGAYSYAPGASNYYAAAQGLANNNYNAQKAVADATIAGNSAAAKLKALQDAQNAYKRGASKSGNKNFLNIYGIG